MNGHILPGTGIAVDYWKVKRLEQNYTYFLTHFHGDHITGLTSSWKRDIYCSEFTAYLLQEHHGLRASVVKVMPLNQTIIVSTAHGKTFNVTALEANHCPGAVMFYFEGDFGKILYTGDFRFSSKMRENLRHLRGCIDVLYLDNTFCDPKCTFPPRKVSFNDIVTIVKEHPSHDIVIGVRNLGKEHMLANLGTAVNETISVSSKSLLISQMLFDTDVFTTAALSKRRGRIRTHPMREINKWFLEDLQKNKPTIAIIPSAISSGLGRKSGFTGKHIFVVPYSDHSSYPELMQFVSMLAPGKVLPIVSCGFLFGSDTSNRSDMSCFDKCLRTVPVAPSTTSQVNETGEAQALQFSNHCSESEGNDLAASVSASATSTYQELCTLSDRASLKRKRNSLKKERAKKIPRGITYDEEDCIQDEQNEMLSREEKEMSIETKNKHQESGAEEVNQSSSDKDNDESQGHESISRSISPEIDCQGNDAVSSQLSAVSEHDSAHEDYGTRTLQASKNVMKDKSCGNIVSTCESEFQRSCDQNERHKEETLNNQLIASSENTAFKKVPNGYNGTDPESSNDAVYTHEKSGKKIIDLKENERFHSPLADTSHSAKYSNVESSKDNVCRIDIHNECNVKNVECNAQSVECNVQSVECNAYSVECNAQSVECNAQSVECNAQSVECNAQNVECNANSVECNAQSVECNVQSVECNAQNVECNAQSVECNAQSVECNAQSVECNAQRVSECAQNTFEQCKEVNESEMALDSDLMIDTGSSGCESNCNKGSNHSSIPDHKKDKNLSRPTVVSSYFKGDVAGNNKEFRNVLYHKKTQVCSSSTDQTNPKMSTGNTWFQNTFTDTPIVSTAPRSFPHSPSVEVKEKVTVSPSSIITNLEQTNVVSASDRSQLSSPAQSECASRTEETKLQTKFFSRERLKAISDIEFSRHCRSLTSTTSIFTVVKDSQTLENLETLRKLHLYRLVSRSSSFQRLNGCFKGNWKKMFGNDTDI